MNQYKKQVNKNIKPQLIKFGVCIVILLIILSCGRWLFYQQISGDMGAFTIFALAMMIPSFFTGYIAVSFFKSWDFQSFVERIENPWFAAKAIFLIKYKAELMGWGDIEREMKPGRERRNNNVK